MSDPKGAWLAALVFVAAMLYYVTAVALVLR
jgi:hypothetical protein